jgi:hypothetical protein
LALAGLRRCFGAAFLLGGVALGRVGFLGVFWRVRGGGYSKRSPRSGVGLLGRSCSSALRRHPHGCRLLDDALAWARGEGLPSAFEPISASPDISLADPGGPSLVLFLSATIFSLFKMVPWWQRVVKLRCVCGSGNVCYFSWCAVCCP